jgi:hypothetical protein
MKRITFCFCLFNLLLFGQPVLNASDIISSNYTANYYSSVSSTITAGSPGPNQIWDFSSLPLTIINNYPDSMMPVVTAPFSNSFPESNFFVEVSNSGFSRYFYQKLSADKLEYYGSSYVTGIDINYFNPKTEYIFPFTYNSIFNDTYQSYNSIDTYSITKKYDAYGSIVTTFGNFSNVFRIKTIENGNINYIWFQQNPLRPIVFCVEDSDNVNRFYIYEFLTLKTTEYQTKSHFSIYPNPNAGDFTIQYENLDNKEFFVNIYDILGNQIIKNEKLESTSKNINSSDFASGLYLIKITDVNNTVLFSDKIIKK